MTSGTEVSIITLDSLQAADFLIWRRIVAKKTASGNKTSKAKSDDNVVRIKASSSTPKKEKVTKVAAEPAKVEKAPKVKKSRKGAPKFIRAITGYFTGAWYELRQVRWPNRRATWSLTGAVLVYTAFFVVLVLLLDAGFKYLFEIILGK